MHHPSRNGRRDRRQLARPPLSSLAHGAKARTAFLGSILAVHIATWTLALFIAPTHIPHRQLIAEGFSTFAIVLVSVNLMLSTRAGFLERRLDGLDKLFVTHRTIGLSVALLVTTHFVLVPKSVGWVASKPFGYTTLTLLLAAIFVASAPRFPWRRLVPLKYQTWKFTHRFMGVLLALAVTHSLLGHTYVRRVPLLAGYVYGIAALGLAAYLYREFLFAHIGPFHTYQVERSRLLGGHVTEITLASSTALVRAPGQFVFVSFEGGPSREQHPFTMSGDTKSAVRFSIKAAGDFTEQLLPGVPVASIARIEGPYGAFDYHRGRPHQLWLAGGIGITPFLSMAEALDGETSVVLVWSVRNEHEAIYGEALSRVSGDKPNFSFLVHQTEKQGHVDLSTLALDAEPHECSVFICGPVPMRQGFMKQLKSLNVPRSEIFFEEFRLR